MKRLVLIWFMCMLVGFGCDSESDSQQKAQLFPGSPVGATTTREVPDSYATIQKAIDAANSGDIIRVAAGTYIENVTIRGKRFSLRGAGTGLTIIRGTVRIYDSEDISFEAFTVTGGGIHARKSSVILSGNTITGNAGPGLWLEESSVRISDNVITLNGREGILVDASAGILGSNIIEENTTDGVVVNNSSVQLFANTIRTNGRDGVSIRGIEHAASPNLLQNTIQNNGGISNYDIICFGGNANPTGAGNNFSRCLNCAECRSFADPPTYFE